MTEIEIAAQNLGEKKAALETLYAESLRIKNEELVRNKNLLEATNSEIEQAQKKVHALIMSGASPFNKNVKIERDKKIEASAIRDDIRLAVLADEIRVSEMELQLSTLKRDFTNARNAYLDALANKAISDFIDAPDTRLILAVHLMSSKALSEPSSLDAQINFINSAHFGYDYQAMFIQKISRLFFEGPLKSYATKEMNSELMSEHLAAISTVANVNEITIGSQKKLMREIEERKQALPVW